MKAAEPRTAALDSKEVESLSSNSILSEQQLSDLRSHAFEHCLICGSAVDDPEAMERCPGPDAPPPQDFGTQYAAGESSRRSEWLIEAEAASLDTRRGTRHSYDSLCSPIGDEFDDPDCYCDRANARALEAATLDVEALRQRIGAVVDRWYHLGLIRFNRFDDGGDDLILRDELVAAAYASGSEAKSPK